MGVLYAKVDEAWEPISIDASVANPLNALGVVAMGSLVAGTPLTVGASTTTTITNALAFTTLVGRRYRLVCQVRALSPSAGAVGSCYLRAAGPGIAANSVYEAVDMAYRGARIEIPFDGVGTSGSYTVAWINGPAGVSLYLDQITSFFYLEDIGPNASPAPPVPETPPAWTPLTFQNAWVNYGGGFYGGAYRKIGDEVSLRGVIVGPSVAAGGALTIATLPVGFRPAYSAMFTSDAYIGADRFGRIDMRSNGEVAFLNITGATGTVSYLSLDQVRFSVTP